MHARNVLSPAAKRKPPYGRRGVLLMETVLSLSMITIVGLALLKLSMNVLAPRQSILQQTLVDAYMTYERAFAERTPFEDLKSANSAWPVLPATNRSQVEIGRLPGGNPVVATITRARVADDNNRDYHGGTGTETSNPSSVEIWRVQSVIDYKVGKRAYRKARTVVRMQ